MAEGRLAFIQHSPLEMPGVLGDCAEQVGFALHTFRADHGPHYLPDPEQFQAVIVMGSLQSVNDSDLDWVKSEREFVDSAVNSEVPVLGVCFGGQLLAQVLGGNVGPAQVPEIGWMPIRTEDPSIVPVGPWMLWHEEAFTLPPAATLVASTDVALQAFVEGPHMGVQFHPEVSPALVEMWLKEADGRGYISEEEKNALRENIDLLAVQSATNAAVLIDGFLRRAELPN